MTITEIVIHVLIVIMTINVIKTVINNILLRWCRNHVEEMQYEMWK